MQLCLIPFGFDASVGLLFAEKMVEQMIQSTLHDNDTCVAKDCKTKKHPKSKIVLHQNIAK